ncbi:Protein nedd1 [Mactra antiquata]
MDLKLLSAGDDIKFWDCPEFILTRQFNPHDQNITSVCWANDNSYLASISMNDEKIVITDTNHSKKDIILPTGSDNLCIDVNDTSRYLLSGSTDGIISVWDLNSQKVKKTYKNHKGPVTCARFNQGTSCIASGSETGEIIIYNVITGQGCKPLIAPNVQAVKQVQFSKQKKSLLGSVSDDGCVNLWDANRRQQVHSFSCHRAPATGLSFSPINDIFLISVGLDKRIACYDVQTKKIVKTMTADSPLTSIDTKCDGVTVVVGSTRGKIYHYDLRMGSVAVNTIDAHKSSVQSLRFQLQQIDTSDSKSSGSMAAKRQTKNVGRQLPVSPRDNRDNAVQMQDNINTPARNVSGDVFSPLREGFQEHSGEEIDSGSFGNQLLSVRNTSGENYTVGVFSPLNENNVGRGSSGIGLSPLALSNYPVVDSNRNSSGLTVMDYNRMNVDNGVTTPQTSQSSGDYSVQHSYTSNQSHNTKSDSHSERTEQVDVSSHRQHNYDSGGQTYTQKHVAFAPEPQDEYAFLTDSSPSSTDGAGSPDLKHHRNEANYHAGQSSSPSLPNMHVEDSSGSAHYNGHSSGAVTKATTPDGVNAQSSVSNSMISPTFYDRQKRTEGVKSSVRLDSKVLSVEQKQIADIVEHIVHEQLSNFKIEMQTFIRNELDEVVHQLHKDITNLQVEMLRQIQILKLEIQNLVEYYSVNWDLISEIQRLKMEIKKMEQAF